MGLAVMDGVRQWSFTTAASPSLHERSSLKKKRRGVATFPPPPFSGEIAASQRQHGEGCTVVAIPSTCLACLYACAVVSKD